MLILFLNKLVYYPASVLEVMAEIINFLIYNCINITKKIYKILKKNYIKKKKIKENKKKITPNLTLYYPLPTSILSVSIRFMGAILLILTFFSTSVVLVITIYQINFQILGIFSLLILYIIISSFGYHLLNSLSHFMKNKK